MSAQVNIQPIHSYSHSQSDSKNDSQNEKKNAVHSIAGLAIDRTPATAKNSLLKKLALITAIIVPIGVGAYYFYADSFQENASVTPAALIENNTSSTNITISQALPINAKQTPPTLNSATNQNSPTNKAMVKVLDASGHIVARRIATVSSRITGKLNKLYIEEGQVVVKEQVLAELDNEQALINYQLSLAALAASEANVEELNVALQYEQQRLTRRQALVKSNLISTQLADDSQLKTKQLSAQLLNRQALVSLAKQKVALANYQLNHHKIRAPFDGVVISKNAQVGELISTGSSAGGSIRTGVGTIVDMSSLEIEVEVGESYINRVYAGQQVQATLDAYPNWHINSEVIAVIPTADKQKASIKVRIKLLETDPRIFPDMSVKVSFLNKS